MLDTKMENKRNTNTDVNLLLGLRKGIAHSVCGNVAGGEHLPDVNVVRDGSSVCIISTGGFTRESVHFSENVVPGEGYSVIAIKASPDNVRMCTTFVVLAAPAEQRKRLIREYLSRSDTSLCFSNGRIFRFYFLSRQSFQCRIECTECAFLDRRVIKW